MLSKYIFVLHKDSNVMRRYSLLMMESSFVKQHVLSPASQSTEEEKDEESQFSEGQLVSTGCQSDDSELSEEIMEGKYV